MSSTATDRLQGLTTSVAVKPPCRTVSTTNITLSGLQTFNGVTQVEDDRHLATGQTNQTENGIYNASSGSWTRAKDFDGNRDVVQGTLVLVISSGVYEVTTADPIVIGTTEINFSIRTIEVAVPINVRSYGIVPNSTAATAANTAILLSLIAPAANGGTHTFTGEVQFPNSSGSDVYYFGDIIPIRDGIHIDLCGSTVHFSKTAVVSDVNVGFFTAIRDFSIENGNIVVDYDAGGTANRGNALMFGWRDSAAYFPDSYDNLLASPMGNIVVRNIRITQNTALSKAVLMFSGLDGVLFENVWIDGQGTLVDGIYYEFGWASNEANREDRQTSHMHNAIFRNIHVNDLASSGSIAIGFGGAYSVSLENIYVDGAAAAVTATPGEALNYRPRAEDAAGVKRTFSVRNVVTQNITGTAINLTGAQLSSGYLAPLGLADQYESDLYDFVVDGFSCDGTSGGYGVRTNGGKVSIKNGTVRNHARGVVTENETTEFLIENVRVLDSTSIGIQLGLDSNIWSPKRQKIGTVRNCFVAGSGTAGTTAAVSVDTCESCLIEECRFGYELGHDGKAETTQAQAVSVGVGGYGVVCRSCYVGGTSGGAAAYALAAALSSPRRCSIENASGVMTRTGLWLKNGDGISDDRGDANATLVVDVDFPRQHFATTLTANRTVTLSTTNAVRGSKFRIIRTGLGAFTLNVGGLKTIASDTAAFVDVGHDGTAWVLSGYGAL